MVNKINLKTDDQAGKYSFLPGTGKYHVTKFLPIFNLNLGRYCIFLLIGHLRNSSIGFYVSQTVLCPENISLKLCMEFGYITEMQKFPKTVTGRGTCLTYFFPVHLSHPS